MAYLGKNIIDSSVLQRCTDALTDRDVRGLVAHADRTPSWMADIILKIKKAKDGPIRKKPDVEHRDIFTEAASRRDVQPIVIEKNFWVCWTLKRLPTDQQLVPHITLKGGPFLSKSYDLIERKRLAEIL